MDHPAPSSSTPSSSANAPAPDSPVPSAAPPLWLLGVAAVILVAGLGGGLLLSQWSQHAPAGTRFLVPGSTTVQIEQPGTYVLWDEYQTIFEGEQYILAPKTEEQRESGEAKRSFLDDGTRINDGFPEGSELFVYAKRIKDNGAIEWEAIQQERVLHAREAVGDTIRTTMGAYTFDQPGEYVVDMRGDFSPAVLHLRPSQVWRRIIGLGGGMILSLLGGLGGPALAVWVIWKRQTIQK